MYNNKGERSVHEYSCFWLVVGDVVHQRGYVMMKHKLVTGKKVWFITGSFSVRQESAISNDVPPTKREYDIQQTGEK